MLNMRTMGLESEISSPVHPSNPIVLTGKRQSQDPVNAIKVVASTMLNSFLEDLKEKNVLNKQELQTMGQTVNVITKKTENLVGDLTEKTQVVGKIFKDHFLNSGSLLSLSEYLWPKD